MIAGGHPTEQRGIGGTPIQVDAKAIANLILDWGDRDGIQISPMKIQKLIFFCHADYLIQYNAALLKQHFEAWDFGPVIPALYDEFKAFDREAIKIRATGFDPRAMERREVRTPIASIVRDRIDPFYEFYRHLSANELSKLSHSIGGPWMQARALFDRGLNADRRISDDLIRRFHRLPQH